MKRKVLTLPELVSKFLRGAARMKLAYKRQDAIFAEIRNSLQVGDTVMVDGTIYELIDNYAQQDIVYRVHGIRRYELKELKGKQA